MGKSLRFLRFFAFLFVVIFTSNAFSAGYNCPEYKKYISCTSGYYLSDCGTDPANWKGHQVVSSPATGNTCIKCPTGYDCSGGAACPSKKKITCSPGYYLPAYSTSCSECGGPGYYCPGGSFVSGSSSAQGRNPVRTGYYSTGGTPTTRTGQSQCTGATYCTGGVQYNCPSETPAWTRYTGTGWTSYTQCYQETDMAPYEYCTAGRIRVYANSATTWGWGSYLQTDAVQAKGGAYVDIDNPDVGAICSPCSAGTYSIGGVVHECSVCGDNTYSSAGASSCTSCYTVNGYGNSGTLASNHANESSCKLTCAAGTYVAASRAACSNVGKGFWRGTHTVSQGSISTRYTCPDTYDDGSATAGSQSECATHCDGGTYVDVAGGTCLSGEPGGKCTSVASGVCVPVDRGYYRTAHTVYYGQASDQKICPENYRDGAPAAILGDCVGRFLKTGTQVEGEVPENCTEVTEWNDCVPPTCYYEKNYSKVITKDCEPGTCTKRPNAVKADANYYDGDGTYCPACSTVGDGTFTLSDPGNEGGNTRCYKNCTVSCTQQECPANASCTHGQETSTGREYYSSVSTFCNASPVSCSLSFTCNPGYEKNEDGTACVPLTYTITYQNGGGVGSSVTQSVVYDSEFTTKSADTFVYPGYNFVEWGSNYGYSEPNKVYTYTTPDNISLVAKWSACPANPNASGTCNCGLKEYPNGSGCSSCDVSCSEELVFNLGSYNVCRNETAGLCYRDCTTSDVSNATAVTGTITKGGTNSCKATSCATGTYLSNGTCATCVANATCAGGTDSFTCNSGYQLSNDGTECEPVSYTITLKKNGGTGTINGSTGTNDATQTCKHGVLCNLPASGLERFGYAFTGWGESEACVDGFTQKAFTEATTLYACWSQQTTPCQPGKYYDGTEHVTCPAGKFCSGEGNANIGSAACALDCPSGGTSTPGATTDLECYKPCSPTLDIQNGQGISEGSAYYDGQEYAACLYRAECDENYVPQNSPSTSPSCVWGDAGNCPPGFYCPPESPTPVACPDGGTSEIGSTEITQCYKIFDDYEGFSNGVATAKCLYQLNTTDYTGCSIINVSSCDGGYWYEQEGDFSCISVTSGFYSPVGRTDRVACPADPAGKPVGSDELASNYTDCYKTCDIDVLHSTEIVAESDTVYAVSADSYDACSFNVSCETGYSVINNNSESPSCDANEYTITLDKNGGSGTTPSSITCVFDSGICELPSVDDLVKLGYTAQDKWCADADGTAPCYYAGQNTSTNISSTGTDTTLYAVWTPNIYEVRLNSVNADLSAAPETVYLKYDNGWFSNSAATTGITNLTNIPEKAGYVFNGFYSEKTSGTQLISPEGNFLTSTEVLEFTTINPTTIYAQWSTGVVYCEPGTYYTGTGTLCEQCIENYYCPGGYFQTDTGSADPESLKACIGIWKLSEPGASKETDCYTVCENKSVENGTAMPENDKEYFATECSYKTGVSNDGNPCDIIDDVCVETSCKVGYEMKNRRCVECNRENAISYKDGGICQIKECVSGFHPVGDRCELDVQSCTAPNAILAEREWDYKNNSFGPCTIKECDYGYHVASNACVSDVQPCNVENGTGFKEWDDRSKKWGDCVATSCAPGYTNDPSESNEPNQQCGECKNKYSVLGKLAVSSYVQGCEIASCMYQGELYNLEYNECVPICPLEEYSDETGSLVWDESRKECVHTCNEGYTMW